MRKKIRHLTACLAAGVLVAAAPLSGGCSQGTPPAAESTAPVAAETVPAEQAGLLLRAGLNRANYAGKHGSRAVRRMTRVRLTPSSCTPRMRTEKARRIAT